MITIACQSAILSDIYSILEDQNVLLREDDIDLIIPQVTLKIMTLSGS